MVVVGKARADSVKLSFDTLEGFEDQGIKVLRLDSTITFDNDATGLLMGEGLLIGPLRAQGIIDVGHGHDPGDQRYCLTRQSVGITGSIPALVMRSSYAHTHIQEVVFRILVGNSLQRHGTDQGVSFHNLELSVVERAWLQQDGVGNAHFANIMQGRSATNLCNKGIINDVGISGIAAQTNSQDLTECDGQSLRPGIPIVSKEPRWLPAGNRRFLGPVLLPAPEDEDCIFPAQIAFFAIADAS